MNHRIFVYGTLLSGQPNNRLLTTSKLLGTAITVPRYTLIDLGGCPAMLDVGTTAVLGEVWEVDETALARIDLLEGHPRLYRRQRAQLVGWADVETYLMSRSRYTTRHPVINGGSWKAHQVACQIEREKTNASPNA